MAEITRIVIKGSSGYGCLEESYQDKVTLTPDSIAYEYIPYQETQINPKRKWSYRTTSPIFQMKYAEIVRAIPASLENAAEAFCTDVGGIEFCITYADKTKFWKTYWVAGEFFKDLFAQIKSLVPECEYTPAVLLTSDDYDDA